MSFSQFTWSSSSFYCFFTYFTNESNICCLYLFVKVKSRSIVYTGCKVQQQAPPTLLFFCIGLNLYLSICIYVLSVFVFVYLRCRLYKVQGATPGASCLIANFLASQHLWYESIFTFIMNVLKSNNDIFYWGKNKLWPFSSSPWSEPTSVRIWILWPLSLMDGKLHYCAHCCH